MATTLENIGDELDQMLNEFLHSSYEKRQEAVQAGAEVMKSALEQASPKDSGEFANSFAIKTKYKDRRYVGNTKTVTAKGREGVPLINILEFKDGGQPFVRNTFEANKDKVYAAIKNKLK